MKKRDIKIILSGLDNAGKSSMLLGLQKMYGFEEDVKKLKPTIRIDYYRREFLNLKLSFFDMGGHEKFRESYLKRPIYFESVNIYIYLIDIQDETRFTESCDYLGKVLNILDQTGYEKEFPIYICFSKSDYELIVDNFIDYMTRMKMIKRLFQDSYPGFKFEFYSTSIYNLYTIVRMISNGLSHYLEGYDNIVKILQEFGEKTQTKQALLFDHTGLVISDFFKAEGEGLELQNKIDSIISGHLEFFGQLEDQNLEITSTRGTDKDYMNICYQFHLYDDQELSDEQFWAILQKKQAGDHFYANYYFSLIVPLDVSIPAENEVPDTIEKVRTIMQKIISAGTNDNEPNPQESLE
jgi:signal recognition particle receptor subunit beta